MKQHIKITTLFVLMLSVVLVGCGGTATPEPNTTENETEASSSTAETETAESAETETAAEAVAEEMTEPEIIVAEETDSTDTDALTILATAVPDDYPSPPTPIPPASYPIPTIAVIDPYAAPEPADVMTDLSDQADADVTYVRATLAADGTWTFEVTISHPDTGESDYADGWDVVTDNNEIIKVNENDTFTRLLTHPHVNEQPFTRSQSGLVIPEEVDGVFIRAHDIVHGWGGQMVFVDFTQDQGPNYTIQR